MGKANTKVSIEGNPFMLLDLCRRIELLRHDATYEATRGCVRLVLRSTEALTFVRAWRDRGAAQGLAFKYTER